MVAISQDRMQQIIAAAKARLASSGKQLLPDLELLDAETNIEVIGTSDNATAEEIILSTLILQSDPEISSSQSNEEKAFLGDIQLNKLQQEAVDRIIAGEDIVVLGEAGTGKTTIQKFSTAGLVKSVPVLRQNTKYLQAGKPGIVICAYTNKAANNIRHVVHPTLRAHTVTIHKLLEYKPNWYEVEDTTNGGFKKTVRFEPSRNASNPLPADLSVIIYEEASMIGVDLYATLQEALPHDHQEIFIGDIRQLPPVFGPAILGFKMTALPVVELQEIYRQGAGSPILDLAWSISHGDSSKFSPITERRENGTDAKGNKVYKSIVPALEQFSRSTDAGQVIFQTWQKSIDWERALATASKFFNVWSDNGYYNPQDDIILMPYNKIFGTIELNKAIAQHQGVKRQATVHEVIAGYNKHYLAIGDRILFDKEDGEIVDINVNGSYGGKIRPLTASIHLSRWGTMIANASEEEEAKAMLAEAEAAEISADDFLDNFVNQDSGEVTDRVNQASHVITIRERYSGEYRELSTAQEINNLLGGYALTIHKFQGSEADRVFLLFHQCHSAMISRELLYTAVTRAKKFLQIIAEKNTFYKGVNAPRIKGDSVLEKAEYFKGKLDTKKANGSVAMGEMAELLDKTKKSARGRTTAPKSSSNPITTISGKPAIDLRKIVPESMQEAAQNSLENWWKVAQQVFLKYGNIGELPNLGYTNRKNCLGLANYQTNTLSLNAVWLCVAYEDTEVEHEMLEETVIHEICHFVAKRIWRETGHGHAWRQSMQAMNRPALAYYYGGKLPPWTSTKNQLLEKIMAEYKLHQIDEQLTDGEEE